MGWPYDNSQRSEAAARTRVVIVGGGTAGWMTAAALAVLAHGTAEVCLIESEEIGIVGVGEATLPHLRGFLERLGVREEDFMAATNATYKLGIEFHDFGAVGTRYIHPFGTYGQPLAGIPFHHYWLRAHDAGWSPRIDEYSAAVMAADARRFTLPPSTPDAGPLSYGYAYQFDATLFAPFLRSLAERKGVARIEGRVTDVDREPAHGNLGAVRLADGTVVSGDLFVDCSGFRSLLLGEALGEPWEDWSHWLPCDRALAAPCRSSTDGIEPFTRAVAMSAGWRWRIPLRSRVGNGYVYASAHCSDDAARVALLASLEGEPLAEPRLLRFKAGRRRQSWTRNVVAIGLASGFLEPLESTSIYLVQMAITGLMEHFPDKEVAGADRDGFNVQVDAEYDRIRDFLILHYHATTRDDSPFWRHVRTMDVPERLRETIELWSRCAHLPQDRRGLFLEPSWVAVLLGQGVVPGGWDPRADMAPDMGLRRALDGLKNHVATAVSGMADHEAFLESRLMGS
jgi:tryptophan halogenase